MAIIEMKKLLILTLVLGMALTANATLQISVDGDPDPMDSMLHTIDSPFVLGIWTDSDITPGNGEWSGWALACDIDFGVISGGIIVPPYDTDPGITLYDDPRVQLGMVLPGNENGVGGSLVLMGAIPSIPAGDTIFDEIDLTVNDHWGDAQVTLYGTNDYLTFTPLDSVIFHAPAEPTSILLLSLGIVAIRQRRTR